MDNQSKNSSASSLARSPATNPNTSLVSERLTSSEIGQLKQAQIDQNASLQKHFPNAKHL